MAATSAAEYRLNIMEQALREIRDLAADPDSNAYKDLENIQILAEFILDKKIHDWYMDFIKDGLPQNPTLDGGGGAG